MKTFNEIQHMAKRYRDVLGMQLSMLERVLNEEHHTNQPMKRRASGELVTDPRTGTKYKVVG